MSEARKQGLSVKAVFFFLLPIILGIVCICFNLDQYMLIHILIPNILGKEYYISFIILGVIWYHQKTKLSQIITLIVYSVLTWINAKASATMPISLSILINRDTAQAWMILAAFFIGLYNGEKGKNKKFFFYIYYPFHIYVFQIIGFFL